MIKFNISKRDRQLIEHIADRGWGLEWLRESYLERLDLVMDITAVHANGTPLRLNDLLGADDFNFAHDISGVCNCLDRKTGALTRGFRPRFSGTAALSAHEAAIAKAREAIIPPSAREV